MYTRVNAFLQQCTENHLQKQKHMNSAQFINTIIIYIIITIIIIIIYQ